jgi:hypothetical protein
LEKPSIFKEEAFRKNFGIDVRILTEDKDRLALITKECFDVMKMIENKIDYVNTMKYKDDKENEWAYYQFGKNEYQADLFFIRNVDRIKLIFNVIKKQKPEYKKKRCQLAKKVMIIKDKLNFPHEDIPDLLPVVYERKEEMEENEEIH